MSVKSRLRLHFPVAARLDGVDRPNAYAKLPSKFAATRSCAQKKTNENSMTLIQHCSSVLGTFVSSVRYAVINVFVWRSVAKVLCSVVISVPIHMPNDHSIWPKPQKRLSNSDVNIFGRLPFVLRPFLKAYGEVRRRGIRFADKSLTAFDRGHAAKAADFVSIMPYHGQPNLRGICHG